MEHIQNISTFFQKEELIGLYNHYLVKDGEFGSENSAYSVLNLFIASRFLSSTLVARKCQDLKTCHNRASREVKISNQWDFKTDDSKTEMLPSKMSDQPWLLYISYKTLAVVLGHCRIKNKIQKQWKGSLEKFQFRYEITFIIRVMSIKKYRKEGISQKWWW